MNIENKKNIKKTELLEKAKSLSHSAGCYLMKSKSEEVLYVGKAKNLKSRVTSYFNESSKNLKTIHLVERVHDFDFFMVGNEAEALVLENNLIKKHAPKYNIRLRDDKSYPYIVVDTLEPFPTLHYVRRAQRQKKRLVFGPFPNAGEISALVKSLIKSLGLRDCSLSEFRSRKEPCLLFQLKQCTAPCTKQISETDYEKNLQGALAFFQNKPRQTVKLLNEKMQQYSQREEFEHAAYIRDTISLVEKFIHGATQTRAELQSSFKDIDVVAYHEGEMEIDISFYLVRNNLLIGHKNFHFSRLDCQEEIDMEFIRFVLQYYSESKDSFPQVLVASLPEELQELLSTSLVQLISHPIKIKKPEKEFGPIHKLTQEQAKEGQRVRLINEDGPFRSLSYLGEMLELPDRPKRLECFDIAIWQGESPTAGVVVFEEGKPMKKDYRYYHLEVRPEGNNDFAFMREALRIRLEKGNLPDVFVVDGGKGQLSQFVSILGELNFEIPCIALAKEKTQSNFKSNTIEKSEERIFIPGRSNAIPLSRSVGLLKILVAMRDEAHRFSRKLHHKSFHKDRSGSWLDSIEGIGPKTKQKILQKLDRGVQELRELNQSELQKFFDLNDAQARSFFDHLRKLGTDSSS